MDLKTIDIIDTFLENVAKYEDLYRSSLGRPLTENEKNSVFINVLRVKFGMDPLPQTLNNSKKRRLNIS